LTGKRELSPMRWGLIPSWWSKPLKEMKVARQPETIINKPGELAPLFRSLAACVQAVSAAFAQAVNK
jgi:putative SOS response-associated peptidase YedK